MYFPKRKENICPPKDLLENVLNKFIHNSTKLRTTPDSSPGQGGKQIVFYPCDRLLLQNKKQSTANTTTWMNLKSMIPSKKSKPDAKEYIPYDSTYMKL